MPRNRVPIGANRQELVTCVVWQRVFSRYADCTRVFQLSNCVGFVSRVTVLGSVNLNCNPNYIPNSVSTIFIFHGPSLCFVMRGIDMLAKLINICRLLLQAFKR